MTRSTTTEKTSNLNSSDVCGAFSCELAVCMGNCPRVSINFTGFLLGELSSSWMSSGKLVGGTWQGCRKLHRHPPGSYCCRGAIHVSVRLSALVCRLAWSFVTSVTGLRHGSAYVRYKEEITPICCGQSLCKYALPLILKCRKLTFILLQISVPLKYSGNYTYHYVNIKTHL
jgi:hypothetical protein